MLRLSYFCPIHIIIVFVRRNSVRVFTSKELIVMPIHRLRTIGLLMTLFLLLNFTSAPEPSAASRGGNQRFVLVIDAGHGGKDSGATGNISKEKNINLNVALAFGALVERNCPDVKVIYTRKTDVFVTLQGRADIANRNKANLFVSIHSNSMPPGVTAPNGAETYTVGMHSRKENLAVAKRENSVITQEANYRTVYKNFDPNKSESYIIFEFMQDRNMKQSVEFARHIQTAYGNQGRRNKGVHQAGFLVLRATAMPSVLTEVGFISNPEEERFLNSQEGVQKLARALYNGFRNYRMRHYAAMDPALEGDSLDMDDRSLAEADTAAEQQEENIPPAEEQHLNTLPAPVASVVPVATRAFRGNKYTTIAHVAAPNKNAEALVAPLSKVTGDKRNEAPIPENALASTSVSASSTPLQQTSSGSVRTIPLLADAVTPDAHTKEVTLSAPNGRLAHRADAGLRRVDTLASANAGLRSAEVSAVRHEGQTNPPPTGDKPLTIVVIPTEVEQRVAAEALLAANPPPRQKENPVDELPASSPQSEHVHSTSKPHAVPKNMPDRYSVQPKEVKKTTVERPMSVAQSASSSKAKTTEVKKPAEKNEREKQAEQKETKSVKKETKTAPPSEKKTKSEAKTESKTAKTKEETPQKSKVEKTQSTVAPRITFKVQILTSDKPLATNDPRLKGLSPVSFYHIGPLYRYTYGSSHDYAEIKKTLKKVTAQFPNAFIVAFEGDRRVEDMQAAIRQSQSK